MCSCEDRIRSTHLMQLPHVQIQAMPSASRKSETYSETCCKVAPFIEAVFQQLGVTDEAGARFRVEDRRNSECKCTRHNRLLGPCQIWRLRCLVQKCPHLANCRPATGQEWLPAVLEVMKTRHRCSPRVSMIRSTQNEGWAKTGATRKAEDRSKGTPGRPKDEASRYSRRSVFAGDLGRTSTHPSERRLAAHWNLVMARMLWNQPSRRTRTSRASPDCDCLSCVLQ